MIKIVIKAVLMLGILFLATNVALAEKFLVCKAPSSGMAGKGGCINAYNPSPEKVCSGKGEEQVCSTSSLEDLCIKVGQKHNIPFNRFSSGLGMFTSAEACQTACNKNYGGKFEKFGGQCFGVVSQ